jgi:integrase
MIAGKARAMGLGSAVDVTLAAARAAARECRQELQTGTDPIEARKARRAQAKFDAATAMTFRQCAEAYVTAHKAGWRNAKHARQWTSTLATYAYPLFGSLPVQRIDVGLVMKAIEPIWQTKTETAGRLRGRIENVLDWASTRGYRQGDNPARWRGHLENLLPRRAKVRQVKHHPALPYQEIGAFLTALRAQKSIAARALELAILTAVRTGEVIGAVWDEIDLGSKTWTIPAERTKGGLAHRVPLSDTAVAIIESIKPLANARFVFPGTRAGKPLANGALLDALKRLGRDDLTVHGFRSSFRDWAAEMTSYPREVAEMALAHTVGNKVESAYRRGDLLEKRRSLGVACTSARWPLSILAASFSRSGSKWRRCRRAPFLGLLSRARGLRSGQGRISIEGQGALMQVESWLDRSQAGRRSDHDGQYLR